MFKNQINRYLLAASILINVLLLALVFLPDTDFDRNQQPIPPKTIHNSSPQPSVAGSSDELFSVKKVIDGDTISLENGEVVRYIGIDTPESSHSPDCFAQEATNINRQLTEGKKVRLERDISERDRYRRLLRYVYVQDPQNSSQEIFVNEYLVREGYAKTSTFPPDIKYQQVFLQAEREAFEDSKGLWSVCAIATPLGTLGQISAAGEINCVSNTYNCSDFQTQAEAQRVFETCGGQATDIHQLDRDGDGKVCETLP